MAQAHSEQRPAHPAAYLVDPRAAETLDVLGPILAMLTPGDSTDDAPCVMCGTIPPGFAIPLHSHPDPETYLAMDGEMEALVEGPDRFAWLRIVPGDILHVPGNAKHAFRNGSDRPAVTLVITTQRLGRFFREVGEPTKGLSAVPPSPERIQRFLTAAAAHGHWNASHEENASAVASAA